MKENFDRCLHLLLQPGREGGFSNHSKDPGGITMLGVTKRNWEAFVGHPVEEADMRALTPEKVAPFYHSEYYVVCGADRLPAGLDHATFDFAVNSSPKRAVSYLQAAVGVATDGHFGPATLAAAQTAVAASAIRYLCDSRMAYLKGLTSWETFGGGWERRVDEVEAEAIAMAADKEKAPLVS